jgi:hypothetical protein
LTLVLREPYGYSTEKERPPPKLTNRLKIAARIVIGLLALVGLLYVGTMFFVFVIAPHAMCQVQTQSTAISPDGFFLAKYEQLNCPKGSGDSKGSVVLGKASDPSRGTVVLSVPPTTNEVTMTWQGPRKLLLTVPQGTEPSNLNSDPYGGDVIVALRTSGQVSVDPAGRLPAERSVAFASLRRQEDFKRWLGEKGIPFVIEAVRGQEYVIWDERDTKQVLGWEHLNEEAAGASLLQQQNSYRFERQP